MQAAEAGLFTLAVEVGLNWNLSLNITSTLVLDLRRAMRTVSHLILSLLFKEYL